MAQVNFEGLVEMLKYNRAQDSIEDEEIDNNLCPYCNWRLKVKSDGSKACSICGRTY